MRQQCVGCQVEGDAPGFRVGARVRARGLLWDVLGVDGADGRECLTLRCAEGDMTGLSWTLYVPPDRIEPADPAFDPTQPAPLPLWRLKHQAHALDELMEETFVVRDPGRVAVEPYQLVPLMRALEMPRVRLMLADGVGLGKTVQACLIAAELIARRRAHRILIVSPSGPLLSQWERETRQRFGLKFTPITSAADLWDIRRANELGANPFDSVSLCLTSLDYAKQDHVLEELERTAWDLVIIDEAHHCVGQETRDSTRRRRLAEVLADRSDGLLLLTATPHDGHDAHFASLIALLDPSLTDGGGLVGRTYRRHVIRRLKAHIRHPETGEPLFHRRRVTPVKIDVMGPEYDRAREFHRALAAFVVPRLRGSDDGLAFVSLLKRSVSTIAACVETLRVIMDRIARRAAGEIDTKAEQADRARALRALRRRVARFGVLSAPEEAGMEVMEAETMASSLVADEPSNLLALGLAAEARDPKLDAMVMEIRLIRMEYPSTNILIYTEYAVSQNAAARAVRGAAGIQGEVLTISGQESEPERQAAADRFGAESGLILISTDSLAEGLNLQRHCFHLIHLDLPYNPNRLEQRNGRIDRYGQTHEPDIRYLYIPGTFEERLLLHLIVKYEKARAALDVMPDTLGVTAGNHQATLIGGLSERPADLFEDDSNTIRTLDRAVVDTNPETLAALLRDIDRAFDGFERMAVSHGWRGFNAGMTPPRNVVAAPRDSEDLAGFTSAVIAADTGLPPIRPNELRAPGHWLDGLQGLPGIHSATETVRFTRDPMIDGPVAFLGRAHPLVMRAIRHARHFPAPVSAAKGTEPGLLMTYEMTIEAKGRVLFRRVIAVLARSGQSPVACDDWMSLAREAVDPPDGYWNRTFRAWSEEALSRSSILVNEMVKNREAAFRMAREASVQAERARLAEWIAARGDALCGERVPLVPDLFGVQPSGPAWRHMTDPVDRLVSFASASETSGARRREANETLEIWRAAETRWAAPDPAMSRPIGLLMLVPDDAV